MPRATPPKERPTARSFGFPTSPRDQPESFGRFRWEPTREAEWTAPRRARSVREPTGSGFGSRACRSTGPTVGGVLTVATENFPLVCGMGTPARLALIWSAEARLRFGILDFFLSSFRDRHEESRQRRRKMGKRSRASALQINNAGWPGLLQAGGRRPKKLGIDVLGSGTLDLHQHLCGSFLCCAPSLKQAGPHRAWVFSITISSASAWGMSVSIRQLANGAATNR